MCKVKITSQSCPYYKGYESKVDKGEGFQSTRVFDIEDLISLGRKHTCCPYFAARHLKNQASLVFTPYNYILDPQIRKSNSLELKDSIIIFDEGHNIEKMCEESVSSELRSETFALCIKYLDFVLKTVHDIENKTYEGFDAKEYDELNIQEVAKAKLMICDLEMEVDSLIKKTKTNKTNHETQVIFDIMAKISFDGVSCTRMLNVLDRLSSILNCTKAHNAAQTSAISAALGNLSEFIDRLIPIHSTTFQAFQSYKADIMKKFKIFTEKGFEEDKGSFWSKKDPNSWVLYLW